MSPLSRTLLAATGAVAVLGAGFAGSTFQNPFTSNPAEVRAGVYQLDADHGKITFEISHMGFSTYVGQFTNVSATLTLDPANPAASTLEATIPIADVDTNSDGLDAHLQTADFFDAAQFPTATFRAQRIVIDQDDPDEADVTGELTLRGVTRVVTLDVEFNQAGVSPVTGRYVVGFDGETTIRRSEFGINYGLPLLGDEVELHLEGEFVLQD